MLRAKKEDKVAITCEVTPHHLLLTDAQVSSYDTNTKMNPPLRSQDDVDALVQGIASGDIDAIATDHAPHNINDKMLEFDRAPFGIVGLETAVSLILRPLRANRHHHARAPGPAVLRQSGAHPQAGARDAGQGRLGRYHRAGSGAQS